MKYRTANKWLTYVISIITMSFSMNAIAMTEVDLSVYCEEYSLNKKLLMLTENINEIIEMAQNEASHVRVEYKDDPNDSNATQEEISDAMAKA